MKQLTLTFDPPLSPVAPALTDDALKQETRELLELPVDATNETILLALHAMKALALVEKAALRANLDALRAGDVD